MINYLDTSVLVPFFVDDAHSARADEVIRGLEAAVVSDWAALEFSNVIARQARLREISTKDAGKVLADFDVWRAASAGRAETTGPDITVATQLVRRSDIVLRSADAVHIAIAQRLKAGLVTFDKGMAAVATVVGLASS